MSHSILEAYRAINNATKFPHVRSILSTVIQNAQNETLDMKSTWENLEFDPSNVGHKTAMYEIRNTLQTVYVILSSHNGRADELLVKHFLYENHTRLSKMLAASRVMEYRNLASFQNEDGTHVQPELSDIPRYVVMLAVTVKQFKEKDLENFNKNWKDFLEKNKNCLILTQPDLD